MKKFVWAVLAVGCMVSGVNAQNVPAVHYTKPVVAPPPPKVAAVIQVVRPGRSRAVITQCTQLTGPGGKIGEPYCRPMGTK